MKRRYLDEVLRGLIDGSTVDKESGLWVAPFDDEQMKILRNAYKGLSGLLYLLALYLQQGFGSEADRRKALWLAEWLLAQHPTEDTQMPGLFSGEAGVAVAMLELWQAGLLEREAWLESYFDAVARAETPSLDITHGAAGQGLACLALAERFDRRFMDAAARQAERILAAQRPDGGWDTAWGSYAGKEAPQAGFAHGVAGLCYFLARYGLAEGDPEAVEAGRRGSDWIWAHRIPPDGESRPYVQWAHTIEDRAIRNFWCHGALGIGLCFLELHRASEDPVQLERAYAALDQDLDHFRIDDLGLCHGVAGHGAILLDAYRYTGDRRFLRRVREIWHWLNSLSRWTPDSGLTWLTAPHAHPTPTMSLMVGGGGVAHFALSYLGSQTRPLRFPLL